MSNSLYIPTSHPENPFKQLPTLLERAKLEKKDTLSPEQVSKNFDFVGSVSSLNELENACMAANNGRDSLVFSVASTTDCFGLDSRSLTRMQSLEPEIAEHHEEDSVTPKFNGGRTNAAKLFEEDNAESEACSFMVESLAEISEKSSVQDEEEISYWTVCPSFEKKQVGEGWDYFLENDNQTLVCNNGRKFSTVYAEKPLPKAGRTKFSIQINNTLHDNPKLYVGVAEKDVKGKSMAYKNGFYFLSAFSGESYLNGVKILSPDCFVEDGQVISIIVDIDQELIIFEKDDVEILRGDLNVNKKNGKKEFFPCIAIGELKGEVSFVWN